MTVDASRSTQAPRSQPTLARAVGVELVENRTLLFALLANQWARGGVLVEKSRQHAPGRSVRDGGFVVAAQPLAPGSVGWVFDDAYWDLFDVPVVDHLSPELVLWDDDVEDPISASGVSKYLRLVLAAGTWHP